MRSFAERAAQILKALDASSAEIARCARYGDASNISRLVSGARVPKNNGTAARRLVEGLYLFADARNKMPVLRGLVLCGEEASADDVKGRLMSWLFEGVQGAQSPAGPAAPSRTADSSPAGKKSPFRPFGEKLDAVMDMAELSNARLGKLVNLDASYISRFRSGFRSPRSNSRVVDAICAALVSRLFQQGRMETLGRLAGIPGEDLSNKELCVERLHAWLCDFEAEDNGFAIEQLIKNIGSFPTNTKIPLLSLEEAAEEALCARTDPVYFGTEGLKDAVIRFLGSAIRNGTGEMRLYSDQNMGWMVDDAVFHLKWASLMRECVQKGIRIRIIHNIDRDLGEMIDAINSWLPLYMSGMIESWHSKKQRNSRFSHTIFLCPGQACIEACNVSGREAEGVYRYHTDPAMLRVFQGFYDGLLDGSRRLVRVTAAEAYEEGLSSAEGGITTQDGTLSLAAMPDIPFADMRIILTERAVSVVRLKEPHVAFTFTHPAMVRAFSEYLNRLKERDKPI